MAESTFELCGVCYDVPSMSLSVFKEVRRLTGMTALELKNSGNMLLFIVAIVAIATKTDLTKAAELLNAHIEGGGSIELITDALCKVLDQRTAWLLRRNATVRHKYEKVI